MTLPEQPELSVVSPVYLAETMIEELVRQVCEHAERATPAFELVLVEDGSPDRSWERIERVCAADRRVRGIRLSRNFGQHRAIAAGLDHARGAWVAVIDCDLQDDPAYLPELYARARQGFDVVLTRKARRRHPWLKNLFAGAFLGALGPLLGARARSAAVGSYSLLSRRAVDAYRRSRDLDSHYLGVLGWIGLDATEVAVVHRPRPSGASSYTPRKLLSHALGAVTTESDRLLSWGLAASALLLLLAVAGAGLLTALYFIHGFREGWASTMVLMLLCTSSLLFSQGVLGLYLRKTFEQTRQRPHYLVQETRNL